MAKNSESTEVDGNYNDKIKKINEYYDELLVGNDEESSIKDEIAQTLEKVQKEFNEIEEFHLQILVDEEENDSIKTEVLQAKESIDENCENSKGFLSEIESSKTKINEYYDELLVGNDEESSIKDEIAQTLEKVQKEFNEIEDFHTQLLVDEEENDSIKTEVLQAKESITEDSKSANEVLLETTSKIDELKIFYNKIFGTPNEENILEGGLKNELDARFKELLKYEEEQKNIYQSLIAKKTSEFEQYIKEQEIKHTKLFEKVESLLPGATSAGLAKAYQDRKEIYKDPIFFWNALFFIAMGAMILFGIMNLGTIEKWEDSLNHILHFAPVYLPAIWLAMYASQRRSESRAFVEDYAHKEALAKSYSSYKMQIDELGEKDNTLIKKLLDKTIDTVSENPSKILDKKHGDNTPMQELVDNLKSFFAKEQKK